MLDVVGLQTRASARQEPRALTPAQFGLPLPFTENGQNRTKPNSWAHLSFARARSCRHPAAVLGYVVWRAHVWWQVDNCLDRGGCWVYGQGQCRFHEQTLGTNHESRK